MRVGGQQSVPSAPGTPLGPGGLRRVLWVLCLTEVVSWGILYYAFPVLSSAISADTGWSTTAITAAFSLSLIVAAVAGIPIGKRLDRRGPRGLMTAGSVVASGSVVALALSQQLWQFFLAWTLAGITMAAVFYQPAFAALTRWWGPKRVTALTLLTLAGGLSSTIFAPVTSWISSDLDWRRTYLVLAVVLAVLTVPTHWWGLRGHWPEAEPTTESGRSPRTIVRSGEFITLTMAVSLTAFALFAAMTNLVPLTQEFGWSAPVAAVVLGVGGIGQVAGRFGYQQLAARTSLRTRMVLVFGLGGLTIALQAWLPGPVWLLVAVSVLSGAARGILTLIQATSVSERWGTEHYGRLSAILGAPVLIGTALAPVAGSVLADLLGSYSAMFLALAGVSAVATACATASRTPRT